MNQISITMIILELSLATQYLMDIIVIPVFYVLIAAIIPFSIGRKRQIGFGWSWFFCIAATPIVGLIITLLSKRLTEKPPSKSIWKVVIGWVLIVIVSIGFLSNFTKMTQDIYQPIGAAAYFFLGVYLIGIGKGKVYNKKYIKPKNI